MLQAGAGFGMIFKSPVFNGTATYLHDHPNGALKGHHKNKGGGQISLTTAEDITHPTEHQ